MNTWFSLLIMIISIYLVRLLPMLLLRKNITNRYIRSFLYYVPYVTLAVMTFPAIIQATAHPLPGIIALCAGLIAAWFSGNLFLVAICCCLSVYLCSFIL